MRLARRLLAVLVLCQGCGTAVYTHKIDITVTRDGAPVENRVAIFDHSMGYSREWAERSLGVSRPAQPYAGSFSSTATVTLVDRKLPSTLDIAFALPEVSPDGYYLLIMQLPAEGGREGQARFVRFDEYFPAATAASLPVKYVSMPEDKGWRVRLDIQIGAGRTAATKTGGSTC
jgi:hypothetical protein